MTPQETLQKYWGFSQFRPQQEVIINAVLNGKDAIALLPTGGGKSLCYQVPGVMSQGLTIVVSPLISLMLDQVQNLNHRQINAVALVSGLSANDVDRELDNCVHLHHKFLYLSPERLKSKLVIERISKMKVSLIAVDEAHCISQWGHDFRPSYLDIKAIREVCPNTPFLALTATANKRVLKDIQTYLDLKTPQVFKNSFLRNNISLNILNTELGEKQIIDKLKSTTGTAIVYVRSRRKTIEMAQLLNYENISADFFHGGLDKTERLKKQTRWMQNQTRVIVATTAFGMGIDKPDVRYVFHPDLPEDLESYYQEIGRAGRDGQPSFAFLYFHKGQLKKLRERTVEAFPDMAYLIKVYSHLCSYLRIALGSGNQQEFNFNFLEFNNKYKLNKFKTLQALHILNQQGYVFYNDANTKASTVWIKISTRRLFQFQEKNLKFSPLIQILVRNYGGILDFSVGINESFLSSNIGCSTQTIRQYLSQLDQMGVLNYHPEISGESLVFLTERLNENHLGLDKVAIGNRYKDLKNRFEAIQFFVEQNSICRNRILLDYFDETLKRNCNNCDVCCNHTKVDIEQYILDSLKTGPKSFTFLKENTQAKREDLIAYLRILLNLNKISKDQDVFSTDS